MDNFIWVFFGFVTIIIIAAVPLINWLTNKTIERGKEVAHEEAENIFRRLRNENKSNNQL